MKRMKNTIALILAVALMFSLTVTAFAADEKGSITITGVSDENVYEIYQLLVLESYDTESGAYSYKVHKDWEGFFATDAAKAYFTVDEQGYATWTNAKEDDATVAAFAKIALQYAKDNTIYPLQSSRAKTEEDAANTVTQFEKMKPGFNSDDPPKATGTFDELQLGYYLIDSTMGALCGLTTTNPDAYINAKNAAPTINKQVKEDSTDQWVDSNTADIGQTVEFRTTVNVHAGAEKFVLHDKMSASLTFGAVTKVEHVIPDVSTTPLTLGDDYTVEMNPDCDTIKVEENVYEDCTFEVVFSQAFCDKLDTNNKIIVYYTATLNENAVIAGDGNTNKAFLEFGDEHFTEEDSTTTKTFGFDLVKTNSQNKLIDGAEFKIYDAVTGGNEILVIKKSDGTYRRAMTGEKGESIVVEDGLVRVEGFDNGTYYLEETVTPEGYNSLAARQKFTISDGNLNASITDNTVSSGSGVHVVNKAGTMLPETGGMGTTLFITFGLLAVLGTGVLLVTKKRMGMIQD